MSEPDYASLIDAEEQKSTNPAQPDYGALIDATDAATTDRNISARRNVLGAFATTPEKATQARTLAEATGTPAQVIQRDPAPATKVAALQVADAALASSPVLHAHVASDPSFTAQASDELPLLAQLGNSISRGWRGLKQALPSANLASGASALAQMDAIDRGENVPLGVVGEAYQEGSPETRKYFREHYTAGLPQQVAQAAASVAQLEAEKRTFPTAGTVTAALSAPTWTGVLKGIARHPIDYLASQFPEAIIGSIPGMVAAVPASAAGPGGSAIAFGATSTLQTVGPAIIDELARQGVNTADPQALAAALQNPQIGPAAIDKGLKRAGIAGVFGAAGGAIAGRFGAKVLYPSLAAIGAAQPAVEGAATGEPATPGEIIAGALASLAIAPGEAASTVLARTHAVIARAAEPVAERNIQAHRAVADAQTLVEVSDQVAQSKLRTRDPEAFKEFAQRAIDESGGAAPEHVYISAADLGKALEQVKPEQLAALAPSIGRQIDIARLTGADLQIPMADYLTHLAGTDVGETLIPHLRTAPDALTGAEALTRNPVQEFTQSVHELAKSINASGEQSAIDALNARTLRNQRMLSNAKLAALKDLQADAAAKRAAIEAEVTPQVQAEPVYKAARFIKDKKLNTAALRDIQGDGEAAPWRYLPGNMLSKEGGLHPNVVAEMHGFPSGDHMVRAILAADPEAHVIEAMTDRRLLERHGDLTDPKVLERAAEATVAHEARANTLAAELAAVNKTMGSATEIARKSRDYAEGRTAQQKFRDLAPGQWTQAEARATKAYEDALRRGQTREAAIAKREELISNRMARAVNDAKDELQTGLEYLRKFDRPGVRESIDLQYRDQIDALLDRFDLRTSVSAKELDKRESLAAFVARMEDMGYEPDVPKYLLDELNRQHYKNMTVEQFRGLLDAVKSIEHLGRLKNKLLDLKEQRDLDTVAAEAQATMDKLPGQVGPQSNRGLTRIEKKWASVKAAGRSMGASLLKMEQMMDWLDARDPNGVFNRVVFRRIADAGSRENDMQQAMSERIKTLVHAMPKDMENVNRIYIADGLIDSVTGQRAKFTKKEILALAGNVGNESNMAKVLAGEGWTDGALWDFLHKTMTKADWDFVQGLGDAFESLWPEKLAMSRRLGNTNPEKIEPRPFTTPHGDYEGWYWPMVYDPTRSQDVAERGARKADAMFENIYRRANTDTGRMNSRVDYARPVLFNLDAVPRVIRDEIHDIAYREAVIDSSKFLSHGEVRDGIVNALGQEYYGQLPKWLQSIANDKAVDGATMAFWEGFAHKARVNATMAGLGFRLTTILVHGTSAGMESVAELGPKWFASGLADFRNPGQWRTNRDFVFERSPEMAHRMNEVDRDIREHLRELDLRSSDPATGAVTRGLDKIKANAYMGIAMIDMATALPTWMGAYKKAMTPTERGGLGVGEQDAVYFADKTVRNAHGGTGAKDLARVQRGDEFFKLLTMFYSFWNHNVNRLMDTGRLAASLPATLRSGNGAQFRGDLGRVMMRTLIYTLGVQMVHSALQPKKEGDDEEGWGAWAAKELLLSATAGIPVIRDLSAHWLEGKDYSVTPAASAVRAIEQTGHDATLAAIGEDTSGKWIKHAANTAGYVFGLPTGQAGTSAQFLWDVAQGNQDPRSLADWWNGILHGDVDSQ